MKMNLSDATAVIALLAERWPITFSVYEALNGAVAPQELGQALRRYVGNAVYLRRMVAGAARIGLDGSPVGAVTAEEQAAAAARLEGYKRRKVARAAAEVVAKPPASVPVPPPPPAERRISLADLRLAAQRRAAQGAAVA
jgi:sRNA-binding protein